MATTSQTKIHGVTFGSNLHYLIRNSVRLAVQYWPNGHLGEISPDEDIRSAFARLRMGVERGQSLIEAAHRLELDAYNHADM